MPEAMPAGFHEAGRDSAESERGSRPGFRAVRGEWPGRRVRSGVSVCFLFILLYRRISFFSIIIVLFFFFFFFFAGRILLRDSFRASEFIFYQ